MGLLKLADSSVVRVPMLRRARPAEAVSAVVDPQAQAKTAKLERHIADLLAQVEGLEAGRRLLVSELADLQARYSELETLSGSIARERVMEPPLKSLAREVALKTGLSLARFLEPGQHGMRARARQDFMVRAQDAGFSASEIARFLGLDHTTVLSGIKSARRRQAEASERQA